MKKILLIGPIGDYGGREIEASFIASTLSELYHVEICSTGRITKKSQVFDFNPQQKILSLPHLMLKKYLFFRVIAFFSLIKNNFKGSLSYYAKNQLSKKMGYEKKVKSLLEDLIPEYDLIFICAQLGSAYIPEIVQIASKKNIKIVFRTTGVIENTAYDYLDKVDCFLHHSMRNANRIGYHYQLIDQCALNENSLIEIPLANKKVKNFLTIARLIKEKNVDVVITAFIQAKAVGDKLYVVGDGPKKKDLMRLAANEKDIIFLGHVDNDKIAAYFAETDCLIVSHYDAETGPLTGIEAMAAGRIIISSKTGAMQERLPFSDFWFDNNANDLAKQIKRVKKLDHNEIVDLSNAIRSRYMETYNKKEIGKSYLNSIKVLIS